MQTAREKKHPRIKRRDTVTLPGLDLLGVMDAPGKSSQPAKKKVKDKAQGN